MRICGDAMLTSRQHASPTVMFLTECLHTKQPSHFLHKFTPVAYFTDGNPHVGLLASLLETPVPAYSVTSLRARLHVLQPIYLSIRVFGFFKYASADCSQPHFMHAYIHAGIFRAKNVHAYRCALAHSPHPSFYFSNISAYIRTN